VRKSSARLFFALLFPMFRRLIFGLLGAPLAHGALAVANLFPAPGATTVSPDSSLRITFAATPEIAATGRLQIHDAVTRAVVDTIDLAVPVATKAIGGLDHYRYSTFLLSGRDIWFFPRPGALAYGRSYYVTVDDGAVRHAGVGIAGLDRPNAWSFSTRAAPPASGTPRITVAADGTGDFCTVQGALDFVPEGNTAPTTIFIRKGTYREIIFFTDKHNITILGEDRRETVVAYANNAKFNPSGGNPFAGPKPDPSAENPRRSGSIYRRGMFLAHRVSDFTLANLTLRNLTPSGGSQAEALIVNGTLSARTIIKDIDCYSFQDTVQLNGQAYVTGCFFEGDVDFMWGTGPAFFENCTARSVRSGAYFTQVRNPGGNHGFVFHRCTFEGAPGVTGNFFSRIEPHRFPHSEVVLLDCVLGPAVGSVGWQLQAPPAGTAPGSASDLHFWEFGSRTPVGTPVDVAQRLSASRQMVLPADASLVGNYSNPTFVLGGDWNPRLAPVFHP